MGASVWSWQESVGGCQMAAVTEGSRTASPHTTHLVHLIGDEHQVVLHAELHDLPLVLDYVKMGVNIGGKSGRGGGR